MMIKISLNKDLDYEVYRDFCNYSVAGVNFGEKIKKDHPEITLDNYKKYIDDYYIKNQLDLLNKCDQTNQLILSKQNKFFNELKNLFEIDFIQENYQGYLSIFNCNPRYLDTKTFQIFYKKELSYILEVIFHESLHFAFFEYLDKNFSEQTKDLNKNKGILWELSEIINVIILNLPPIRNILEVEEMLFYPELQDKLEKTKKLWDSCGNLKEFLSRYIEINIKNTN